MVFTAQGFTHPPQVIPDQQIRQEPAGNISLQFRLFAKDIGQLSQPRIRWVASDNTIRIGPQGFLHQAQKRRCAGFGQFLRYQCREQWVTDLPGAMAPSLNLNEVGFNLLKQNRGEVDHGFCLRLMLQVGCHITVILDGVQIHPGKQELACAHVLIGRLVHVPAKHHRGFRVRGHEGNPARASRA